MACDCLDVMDAKLAEHNTKLVRMFCTVPAEELGWYDTVTLDVEKIQPRKRDRIRVAPTFCPFCGARYVAEPSPSTVEGGPGRAL